MYMYMYRKNIIAMYLISYARLVVKEEKEKKNIINVQTREPKNNNTIGLLFGLGSCFV